MSRIVCVVLTKGYFELKDNDCCEKWSIEWTFEAQVVCEVVENWKMINCLIWMMY